MLGSGVGLANPSSRHASEACASNDRFVGLPTFLKRKVEHSRHTRYIHQVHCSILSSPSSSTISCSSPSGELFIVVVVVGLFQRRGGAAGISVNTTTLTRTRCLRSAGAGHFMALASDDCMDDGPWLPPCAPFACPFACPSATPAIWARRGPMPPLVPGANKPRHRLLSSSRPLSF